MLKKIYNFLRSMRFGVLLLIAIGILCMAATFLDQEAIYSSWPFISLFCLLALNLLLCSVVRVTKLGQKKASLLRRAEQAETVLPMKDGEAWLKKHHFRKAGKVYMKHALGFYGTFITHLSILLLTLAAGFLFAFVKTTDISIFPGESYSLPDGTELTVTSFQMEDENGTADYRSELSAVLPSGQELTGEISVNYPMTIGQYKVYQQSYAYAVPIGVQTSLDEEEAFAVLDEAAFLTLDDVNGVMFQQIFGNVVEEDGEIKISTTEEIINPAYEVTVIDDGETSTGIVYPGTMLEAGDVYYTFYEPQAYPGLRFKTRPVWAVGLLYLSFVLMLLGLTLCFSFVPEAAALRKDGIALVGQKDLSARLELYKIE